MAGIVFLLHFGLFHVLSCAWRAAGVDVKPLMAWPLLAENSRSSARKFRKQLYSLIFFDSITRVCANIITTFSFNGVKGSACSLYFSKIAACSFDAAAWIHISPKKQIAEYLRGSHSTTDQYNAGYQLSHRGEREYFHFHK